MSGTLKCRPTSEHPSCPLALVQRRAGFFDRGLCRILRRKCINRTTAVDVMADDTTVEDFQVFAPAVVPQDGQSCETELLTHSFGKAKNLLVLIELISVKAIVFCFITFQF